MHFYDVVFDSCGVDAELERKLGFQKIGVAGVDVAVVDLDKGRGAAGGAVAVGRDRGELISAVKGGASGVVINGSEIEKELIKAMVDNACALFIQLSDVMHYFGIRRSRLIYRDWKLFSYARKAGLDVGFLTLARSRAVMCSYMQMIELAKIIGADERYARESISRVNGALLVRT